MRRIYLNTVYSEALRSSVGVMPWQSHVKYLTQQDALRSSHGQKTGWGAAPRIDLGSSSHSVVNQPLTCLSLDDEIATSIDA